MIKLLTSEQSGAPVLCGQPGSLIALLDAVLLNGFGAIGIDSITASGLIATVTVAAGHQLREHTSISISGAAPATYNGEFQIFNCSSTTFDITLSAAPATSPATGDPIIKFPPLGWSEVFAADGKKVYRPAAGLRHYFKFDENPVPTIETAYGGGYRHARAFLYETMADIEYGLPALTEDAFIQKSRNEDATPVHWLVVGDERCFWLFIAWHNDLTSNQQWEYSPCFFGEIGSNREVDPHSSGLCAGKAAYSNLNPYRLVSNTSTDPSAYSMLRRLYASGYTPLPQQGMYILKDHTGINNAAPIVACAYELHAAALHWTADFPYPNPADAAIYAKPVHVLEPDGVRGRFPGIYSVVQRVPNLTQPCLIPEMTINGTTRQLMMILGGSVEVQWAIDITGPWGVLDG